MSNIANIKKKLALLELPGIQGVLFDALVTYKGEARGEEVDVKHLAEMAEAIAFSLKRQYLGELPKKEDNVIQRDLEDLIKAVKDGTEYQSINYIALIPILVNEIQLLKEEVRILKEKDQEKSNK